MTTLKTAARETRLTLSNREFKAVVFGITFTDYLTYFILCLQQKQGYKSAEQQDCFTSICQVSHRFTDNWVRTEGHNTPIHPIICHTLFHYFILLCFSFLFCYFSLFLFSPLCSSSTLSHPFPSFLVLSHPFLFYPNLSYPILFHPFLSFPSL